MVQLDVVRSCNSIFSNQPLVAVFVSTSGIGEFTIRALASTHQGKGLRVYLVGRNAAAAEKIISDCASVCPDGRFRFVQAGDLSLLGDVDRACAEITRLEEGESANGPARVDLLVQSQATFLKPRLETTEGLEQFMSLVYYSRMRFIVKLLPLLSASTLPSAHVISVFAAGKEGKLFEDLSLRDPKQYSFTNARSHIVYMTTLFMERLAQQNRLSLVHLFPGLVITDAFESPSLPTWFKFTWKLASPLARLYALPREECGQRVLFLATSRFPAKGDDATGSKDIEIATGTDGIRGSGAYAVGPDGETIPTYLKAYQKVREENLGQKVWDHTMSAFNKIESGGVFTE